MPLSAHDLGTTGVTNLLSLILVVVTGVYVYLTWKIARSNQDLLENAKKQQEEEVRPWVYAELEFREQVVVRLVISNKGRTPAYNLDIVLDKNFYQFANFSEENNIKSFPPFNQKIGWFPPGAEILIDLAQGFNFDVIHEELNITPSKFDIEFRYDGKVGNYSDSCCIDVSPYFRTHVAHTASEHLSKIEKHLGTIARKLPG